MRLLVTGGCGFVGSNFVRWVLRHYSTEFVSNVDALTYAGNLSNTADLAERYGNRYEFYQADIANADQIDALMSKHKFYAVINFAAESHVDRSINSPQNFVHTNVAGTAVLLERARAHGVQRFVQVSTDEVYGSAPGEEKFTETSPLNPSSPYSASKASADLLALGCVKTYRQEVVITRCSNNYGPYQHPEKMIPRMITQALLDRRLPVYGDGQNIREWIHVDDHCSAIVAALLEGRPGEIYNVSCGNAWKNIDLVHFILDHLGKPRELVEFVTDRPGHDLRYAVDETKIREQLQWKPIRLPFEKWLRTTIDWYVENRDWWERLV